MKLLDKNFNIQEITVPLIRNLLICIFLCVIGLLFFQKTIHAIDLPTKNRSGVFFQNFSFELITTHNNRYFNDGALNDESLLVPSDDREISVGENYVFQSRTAFMDRYYAFLLDYRLESKNVDVYNSLNVLQDDLSFNGLEHEITPSFFAIFWPIRIGLSYHWTLEDNLTDEVITSLRPGNSLSFHFHLFIDKIPKTALGLGANYQLSFDPTLSFENIGNNLYHKLSGLAHIYFSYYVHFRATFSWERSEEDYTYGFLGSEDEASSVVDEFTGTLPNRSRYYLEYLFIYHLLEEVSLSLSMEQMVYSNYESPIFNFTASVQMSLGKLKFH